MLAKSVCPLHRMVPRADHDKDRQVQTQRPKVDALLIDGKVIDGPPLDTPQALILRREPKANVERYDALRSQIAGGRHAS